MDWDDVRSFLAIARARTLSGAARDLGVRQSTMSRRLEAMEARAGARLVQRTPRGYELTALGEAVLGNAERMEAEAIAVERLVQGRDVTLSGVVRLTTVEAVAERIVPAALARLQARYPGITVDLMSDPRSYNLSRREADIAIRMTRFEGNELVSRRLAVAAMALYASAGYLDRHGGWPAPVGMETAHSLVTVLEDQQHLPEARWLADRLPKAQQAVRTNNRSGQLAAVEAGLGIACLPCFLADGRPGVVRLTEPGDAPTREIWLGVHEDLRHMPRIRAVIDALELAFADLRTAAINAG